jgi:hypothetical protein
VLNSLNRRAVLIGAAWSLVLLVPSAIVISVAGDEDGGTDQTNWVLVAFLLIVTGYLLGGAQAGKRTPNVPFINGAAAPLLAFGLVQGVGIVRRLIADEGITWTGLVFNALLAPSIGIVGAWFGARRAVRHSEADARGTAPTLDDGGGEPTG